MLVKFIIWICAVLHRESFGLSLLNSKPNHFEIRTVTGEPNYRSVTLTWEMLNAGNDAKLLNDSSLPNEYECPDCPKLFQIFYCDVQSLQPHSCRSKTIEANSIEQQQNTEDLAKHYRTIIDNLRMATKYSFHIKPQFKRTAQQKNQRGMAEMNENEIESESNIMGTIIIPTKEFSAIATKCLPHASQIEVETGPYFGGKISVDGGNCSVKGNPKELTDKYVLIIDHEKCGSLVKAESNTVETLITVQENLGIFTHSTRRFVVICTFQSGMQVVRATFTVPGKGRVAVATEDDNKQDRNGRSRQFEYVDRTGLILKENSSNENEKVQPDTNEENKPFVHESQNNNNAVNVKEQNDSQKTGEPELITNNVHRKSDQNFARLIGENNLLTDGRTDKQVRSNSDTSASNFTTRMTIAIFLPVITVGVFVYVIKLQWRRRILPMNDD